MSKKTKEKKKTEPVKDEEVVPTTRTEDHRPTTRPGGGTN